MGATGQPAVAGSADSRAIVSAVLLMLLAGFMSSLLHVGVRYASPEVPTIEIVLLRSVFTLLVTAPLVFRPGQIAWRSNNLTLQVIRGGIGVASMTTWYYALAHMPLGDAGVLSFTTAIFVTIGAGIYFLEPIGPRRWGAVAVGLLGAVVVLRPGFGVVTWAAVAAIGSSALWATSLLMAKELAKYDRSLTISFYQPLMIAPIAALATIPVWVTPSPKVWLVLFGMGSVAAIGNYCYVQALRIADASVSMPADYVRLLWMVIWGYLLFGELPGWTTWAGAALIVGSTLFITFRESQLARQRKAAK